jgi:predicted Zn-dependent protease
MSGRVGRRTSLVPWAVALGLLAGTGVAVTVVVLQHSPKIGTADLGDATDCMSQGDLDCAEADFRAWLIKHPDDPGANSMMAISLSRDDKDKEALPYFKHAIAVGVRTYDFYETYATSLRKVGDIDGAIPMDQAALALRPSLNRIRATLADELASLGRGAEALKLLQDYDKDVVANYGHPVFTAQIAKIQAEMGTAATNRTP